MTIPIINYQGIKHEKKQAKCVLPRNCFMKNARLKLGLIYINP